MSYEQDQIDMFGDSAPEPKKKEKPKAKGLSDVARRAIKTSVEIGTEPPEEIAYQHTVLCQTSLPYRNPGKGVLRWERKQGNVHLLVNAGEALNPETEEFIQLPLPSGAKPRLILCYLNAEAIKQQSPAIEVQDSLTAFVKRLKLDPKGRNINTIKRELSALAVSTIRFGFIRDDHAITIKQDIVQGFDLWFPKNDKQQVLWPSIVRLSDTYFNSLVNHAVPLDERALTALSHSAMALDIYGWLAQRLHRIPAGRPQSITWAAVKDQFGHGYGRVDNFKRVFRVALKQVLIQYQAADIEEDRRGLTLRNSAPPVSKKLYFVNKPVK